MLPVIIAIRCGNFQCFEAFEDVDDADNYSGVSDSPMVKIPVESDFVIFVWPQKQSKHLYSITEVSVSPITMVTIHNIKHSQEAYQ